MEWPPCPLSDVGIGNREVPCPGSLFRHAYQFTSSIDPKAILWEVYWKCNKCQYEMKGFSHCSAEGR
jgi:hypothetical protein